MKNHLALIYTQKQGYPNEIPYSPHIRYPEYPFQSLSKSTNQIYDSIRTLFYNLNYDKFNFGNENWNPLGEFIKPGNKVVIKPNWVCDKNPIESNLDGLITHTSIIRATLDYIIIALKGEGEIIIGDAPIQQTDFEKLLENNYITEVVSYIKNNVNISITIKDFRREITKRKNGIVHERIFREEKDFIGVDFGTKSFLYSIKDDAKKFRITNYNPNKMFKYHNSEQNIYMIEKEILDADSIIYIPKLKTHRKAGITCCLKNSVGINVQKDCLVHHRKGSIREGGDAYLRYNLFKKLMEIFGERFDKTNNIALQHLYKLVIKINKHLSRLTSKEPYFEGSWYGNDTLWRMIFDLSVLLFYVDKSGCISDKIQRNILYVVDGIIAGEGEGPLEPNNKDFGLLAGGTNPILIDIICSGLIGFDYRKITKLHKAIELKLLNFGYNDLIESTINLNGNHIHINDLPVLERFNPSKGWKNHIEL